VSNPRFSIIPAGAVTDRSLEPRDLQVLCLLGRHTDKAGWCTRSQVKMAQELDCSRGSVQNSLDRLSVAGWIEMKRRDVEVEQAGKQPSRSYAYRVLLDRDDFAFESVTASRDDDEGDSHAENASEEGGCQPVGTPEEVPADQHPGATPYVGTRAKPYVGTKNVPLEQTPIERERDARARDRAGKFLAAFQAKWPSAVADDRQRTAYAAAELTEAERDEALAGIEPFLESLKRLHKKHVPAGWRYLEEKRWTLLETASAAPRNPTSHPRASIEAKALGVLYKIAGASAFFYSVLARGDSVSYAKAITPKLLGLAKAGPESEWFELTHRQAGAWEALLREYVHPPIATRKRLAAGDRAPWEFPPLVDGNLSPATGPPEVELSDQDAADLK
jgi:hypothetical protein